MSINEEFLGQFSLFNNEDFRLGIYWIGFPGFS